MLENFSRSLQSIFDLYKEKRNSYFGFSFSFGMLSLFASLVLSLLVCYAAKAIFDWDGSDKPIFEDTLIMTTFPKIMSYFYAVSFGMYAIYLRKILHTKAQDSTLSEMYNSINEKPTLNGLFESITPRMQTLIISVIVVIGLIYTLLFKEFYYAKYQDWGIMNESSLEDSPVKENFFVWLNAVIELFKQYLPYLGALYIFLSDYDSSFSTTSFSKYKQSIITFLLLSFCIVSISANVKSYLDVYIISFINIPFEIPFVRGVFSTFISVFFGAFCYLGFAASILYSVVNQDEVIDSN
jgi:hypothetical protein